MLAHLLETVRTYLGNVLEQFKVDGHFLFVFFFVGQENSRHDLSLRRSLLDILLELFLLKDLVVLFLAPLYDLEPRAEVATRYLRGFLEVVLNESAVEILHFAFFLAECLELVDNFFIVLSWGVESHEIQQMLCLVSLLKK